MKNIMKTSTMLFVIIFAFALIFVSKTEAQTTNMQTYFDSEVLGLNIQVNATAETLPDENITVALELKTQTYVEVKNFNLSIYGFINGTDKILMANITDQNFVLDGNSSMYNCTFKVPEQVWDETYGEITFAHSAKYGPVTIDNDGITCGFSMTHVENVYLEELEKDLGSLKEKYNQLNSTFEQLNQTYWQLHKNYTELQQNYTSLQGNANELDSTRRLAVILGITTAFFVLATIFLLTRKPKDYW